MADHTGPRPEPHGSMVVIPPTSTYFAQAMGWRPNPDPDQPEHGRITGRSTDG